MKYIGFPRPTYPLGPSVRAVPQQTIIIQKFLQFARWKIMWGNYWLI